jgi:hypothetical protein
MRILSQSPQRLHTFREYSQELTLLWGRDVPGTFAISLSQYNQHRLHRAGHSRDTSREPGEQLRELQILALEPQPIPLA